MASEFPPLSSESDEDSVEEAADVDQEDGENDDGRGNAHRTGRGGTFLTAEQANFSDDDNESAYLIRKPDHQRQKQTFDKNDTSSCCCCTSRSMTDYFSVHAMAPRHKLRSPSGGAVRGLNFYGLAFWGIFSWFILQEIYCSLVEILSPQVCTTQVAAPHVLIYTQADTSLPGTARPMSPLTSPAISLAGPLFFAISCVILLILAIASLLNIKTKPSIASSRPEDLVLAAERGRENTLSVVFFLLLPALGAGAAGYVWELSSTLDNCNRSAIHALGASSRAMILLVAPFLWPLTLLVLMNLVMLGIRCCNRGRHDRT